jgi:hypothetical protein
MDWTKTVGLQHMAAERTQMRLSFLTSFMIASILLTTLGCSGRVRASDRELIGTYSMSSNLAQEQLILRSDKTYIQTFSSPKKQFTNHGNWKSSPMFLDGTQITLTGANLSENDPPDSAPRHGILFLQVHREKGKLRLARNEADDLYYDRVP